MVFKSQICTSVEESKRLLALGLKKETADMRLIWLYCYRDEDYYQPMPNDFSTSNDDIPAWSLHRLMLIADANDTAFLNIEKMYETLIKMIASNIKYGFINKDYLEEKV